MPALFLSYPKRKCSFPSLSDAMWKSLRGGSVVETGTVPSRLKKLCGVDVEVY
jgi:hypothetical protein